MPASIRGSSKLQQRPGKPGRLLSAPLNVAVQYVDAAVDAGHGRRPAYIHVDQSITFEELRRRINRAGNALATLGMEKHHRVAILLPNCPEFIAAFFGAIKIGALPAPMSFAVTAKEHAFLLADSGARAIVTTPELWQGVRDRRDEFPELRHVCLVGGVEHQPSEHDFAALMAAAPEELEAALARPNDPAFWLHTSGSTGTPKWAIHLQRSMLCSERLYGHPFVGLRPGDVVVCGSPCFHAYALGFTTYFALKAGATVVLSSQRSSPAHMFELIRRHRATILVGVPTLYAQLLQADALGEPADLSSLRACFSAAERLPAQLYHRWRERFGVEIFDGMGATETLHTFISNRGGDARAGSAGRVVPGYEVRLVDEHGSDVPDEEIGDLLVRGDSLFAGYWRRPEATRRALQGQWYRTGDKFRRDVDGFYWSVGRADDLLRVSGHWVSPAEVEAALNTHPAVLEAAVVGKQDGDELVKPKAFVVLRASASASDGLADALKLHVKATIAPYQYPRWIEFCHDLPKTATGKIQRYKLR
jgi:benzoate-CoA ligase family protein